MANEQAAAVFAPTGIEGDAEPARQPVENLRRRGGRIEELAHVYDLVFDSGVKAFVVSQEAVQERC
jgi:hypothetical protein